MKRKDILRSKFEGFFHEHSSIVMQTDSEEVDMYGELIGISVLATRIGHFAVLITDSRDFVSHDYLPEYVHICSIDKLLDDTIDVYNSYGYEDEKVDINIMDGNALKDYGDECLNFIQILYKKDLSPSDLLCFINQHIFSESKSLIK